MNYFKNMYSSLLTNTIKLKDSVIYELSNLDYTFNFSKGYAGLKFSTPNQSSLELIIQKNQQGIYEKKLLGEIQTCYGLFSFKK